MELLPKSEAQGRIQTLQSWMQQSSVDAVLLLQNVDIYYFSGTVQTGVFCVPPTGEPIFLVQKSLERARIESPWEKLIPLSSLTKTPDLLAGEKVGRLATIGIEMDVLPTSYFLRLQKLFPDARLIDASEAIRKIRMTKSAYEAENIRRAAKMLAGAFDAMRAWIRVGTTELEVASRLESYLRLAGHQGKTRMRGFNSEMGYGAVSSGPSASHPISFNGPVGFVGLYPALPNGASRRQIAAGEPLIADIVGGYGGYVADKTRTYAVGKLHSDMIAAHQFVLDLNRDVEAMLKPGTVCSSIYSFALRRVADSPYEENFMGAGGNRVRFLGHGVGLELDELPVLAANFDLTLESGMTIAVEPKIFFPSRGGVGIENTYLITETGFEKLTRYPEEIIHV